MGDVGIMGLRPPGSDWSYTKELARLADELGYSCITMGESWAEDAFTSLAQLGAVTSRIRIGTSIVPIYARTPSNLAMTALNMDVMTEGRFFLGLGASGKLVIEDFHGEEFRKPLTRMREYIAILHKAMRGERTRSRRRILPDPAFQSPLQAVQGRPAHLHRLSQSSELAAHR